MHARRRAASAARLAIRGVPPVLLRTGFFAATLLVVPVGYGQDAAQVLQRAASAARTLDYVGTVSNQYGLRTETSRLAHFNDGAAEYEKLTSLDGPAREVIRLNDQVRCYYSDAKLVRVEPRLLHNVFPSLRSEQVATLTEHYAFHKAETARVAGLETQAYIFEPKDGMRYGHKFWADIATGLLLKARLISEKGETVEQFSFTDVQIGGKLDRSVLATAFPAAPRDWQVLEKPAADIVPYETGWVVRDLPPGFSKVVEGYRTLRGKPDKVAHLVFSDGLVAISVFVEPTPPAPQFGLSQQGGINVYSRPLNDHLITVLGEAPGSTVRQIAYSVSHR
jgi:sigma-E factor negative regulatory protein RseB